MSAELSAWWFFLCTVGALNVTAWGLTAASVRRRRTQLHGEAYASHRLQLLLSAGYVAGCAFRSALPVFDIPRICIVDTWLSSVVVGRSVATVAELCFAAQWALLMHDISRATGSGVGRVTAKVVVPLIAIAELCSWYSVLTTSNLGHVFEESIWGLAAALLVTSMAWIWPRCNASLRRMLAAWCAAGIAYVAFMFFVDVPMYWSRWLADEAIGRNYLGLAQGLLDVSDRWTVSHRWQDWKNEVVWMSLYFSVAVWLSLWLVHAPVVARARGLHPSPQPSRS